MNDHKLPPVGRKFIKVSPKVPDLDIVWIWTGLLDPWTIGLFLDHFLDQFLDPFFDQFLDKFLGHLFGTILSGGGRPQVLREEWDAVYQYSGMGMR